EVAIVRPGPIQGDMVHPYLRRRAGQEPVAFPDEKVRAVLERTLGVPLFQEQCMALAVACAGFTPGEADSLRRAMAAWKRKGDVILRFGQKIIEGMTARGYDPGFAERVFSQIKGFSEYGFPESHAASFALIVYASAYLKLYYPAAFAAALINSQPMGFYAPAQIVRDAREHGVEVRPADVNSSAWDCTLEPASPDDPCLHALRLGLRLVRGLRREDADAITAAVERHGPFRGISELWRASGVRASALRRLAGADAFTSMGRGRQRSLWELRAISDEPLPLFEHLDSPVAHAAASIAAELPAVSPAVRVAHDYNATGLSLKAHPVSFLRADLGREGVVACADIRDPLRYPTGTRVAAAGIVLVRQRPGTAHGIVFITLEDETGIANLIVRPKVYQRYRRAVRNASTLIVHGHVERQGDVIHILARRLVDFDEALGELRSRSRDFH
ncbi:MAG: hypothetical protein JSR77_02305, partial [Planctomycetes bacterium]|nr:hypothetical protein [Planctomycetota bacterium]